MLKAGDCVLAAARRARTDMATPYAPQELFGRLVVSGEDIQTRVRELGAAIAADHRGSDLRLITVLRGGVFFLADLCRAIELPLQVDFLAVSSYVGDAPGRVKVVKDLDDSITGANVIVVEDIIDTGLTLNYILRNLREREPASLEVCTMFDKDVRRIVDLPITYRGFAIPDRYVVGYGLDHAGRFRNLTHIAELSSEVTGL